MRLGQYSFLRSACSSLLVSAAFFIAACTALGCAQDTPDPRTVRGALSALSTSIEARDPKRLFRVIDQRARHALASIVDARKQARALIEADYPQNERAAALAALGDAATVPGATELFAARCTEACMLAIANQIGAQASEVRTGDEVEVKTARGTTLHMHAGRDQRFGLYWNTDALSAERDQASRELDQIRQNAEVYRRRRALEAAAAAGP